MVENSMKNAEAATLDKFLAMRSAGKNGFAVSALEMVPPMWLLNKSLGGATKGQDKPKLPQRSKADGQQSKTNDPLDWELVSDKPRPLSEFTSSTTNVGPQPLLKPLSVKDRVALWPPKPMQVKNEKTLAGKLDRKRLLQRGVILPSS